MNLSVISNILHGQFPYTGKYECDNGDTVYIVDVYYGHVDMFSFKRDNIVLKFVFEGHVLKFSKQSGNDKFSSIEIPYNEDKVFVSGAHEIRSGYKKDMFEQVSQPMEVFVESIALSKVKFIDILKRIDADIFDLNPLFRVTEVTEDGDVTLERNVLSAEVTMYSVALRHGADYVRKTFKVQLDRNTGMVSVDKGLNRIKEVLRLMYLFKHQVLNQAVAKEECPFVDYGTVSYTRKGGSTIKHETGPVQVNDTTSNNTPSVSSRLYEISNSIFDTVEAVTGEYNSDLKAYLHPTADQSYESLIKETIKIYKAFVVTRKLFEVSETYGNLFASYRDFLSGLGVLKKVEERFAIEFTPPAFTGKVDLEGLRSDIENLLGSYALYSWYGIPYTSRYSKASVSANVLNELYPMLLGLVELHRDKIEYFPKSELLPKRLGPSSTVDMAFNIKDIQLALSEIPLDDSASKAMLDKIFNIECSEEVRSIIVACLPALQRMEFDRNPIYKGLVLKGDLLTTSNVKPSKMEDYYTKQPPKGPEPINRKNTVNNSVEKVKWFKRLWFKL